MTEITDIEAGLLDGLRTVVEALMAFSYPPDDLAGLLQHQIDAHRDAGRVKAAALLAVIRNDVLDPKRRQLRQALRQAGPQTGMA